MITFNLLFSTYMLLEWRFMLCYYTSAMPVSLTQVTAWLCVKMYSTQRYTTVQHDCCTTCYERPPVLRDRFCWAEGVVAQVRFYCIMLNPSLIASFDMQKNRLHHSVLRAIICWFLDRSDNGEWCTLSTYKIGLKFTILSQEAHFLVIQWSGRGVES